MITTINEFKQLENLTNKSVQNSFTNDLKEHVLAFFIKYGSDYYNNRDSVYEYIQNSDEDNLNDENIDILLNALAEAMHKYEKVDFEPIDSDEYEIESIIDIITDVEEIKKLESAGSNIKSTDLTYRAVDRNDIIWITCMLKARNNSAAYPLGEMGVIKCKVLDTFYGLNKLKQLKASDKIL